MEQQSFTAESIEILQECQGAAGITRLALEKTDKSFQQVETEFRV